MFFKRELVASYLFRIFEWAKLNTILCMVTFVCLGVTWIIFCLPGALLSFCGGVLFPEAVGTPGIFVAWLLAICNQFIAGQICFLVSRYIFYDALRKYFETNSILKPIEGSIKKRGWKVAVLIRAIGIVPSFVSNYGVSATSIKHLDYTIGFIGGWLWELTMVYYGYCVGDLLKLLLGEYEMNYRENLLMVLLMVLSLSLTVLSAIFAYFEIRRESKVDEVPHVKMIEEMKLESNRESYNIESKPQ
eukprot:TRINITY_DN11943_c0_g2_i3.p1 TRINITY_DN11943_c0_g2~~TRINITY_DN11943_c0_g2_i3.p1  ORF type:complete len:246 (+),score=42.39 TRINITY_DN11943_c0_g2_i3:260-997(+)